MSLSNPLTAERLGRLHLPEQAAIQSRPNPPVKNLFDRILCRNSQERCPFNRSQLHQRTYLFLWEKGPHTIVDQNNIMVCGAAGLEAITHRILTLSAPGNHHTDLVQAVMFYQVGPAGDNILLGNNQVDRRNLWMISEPRQCLHQNRPVTEFQVLLSRIATDPAAASRSGDQNMNIHRYSCHQR
jgi:hypothetical protein